ncbi:tetratricopeptide repeat protein [Calothrix sp. FACHB-1219]|uniref:tetratricopeptide repeat protein n=1 Tax=unclassified Calothrix TaxID=2619626 RepID=UPI0016844664|nr:MULTISPECIES: tetratricopeptide repeat protein [unclassified Calothrix]MBD2202889.1 tetratricopeptide repeat protein [Calothrix sp. FACHB-168]MBD2216017.1 tetratricopeptide repeat protein [Calothrix sp. FACHB-1219]
MSVNDTAHTDNFAWNRQVYHRLKLALSLNLRRQIFIAVCDDLHLRNQIAARLHSTLAYPVGQVLYQPDDSLESSTAAYPRLATLRLNLSDPNLIAQINQWLANYPPPTIGASKDTPGRPLPVPAFQIVGVELLTRQSVAIQRMFLHHLRVIEEYLSSEKTSSFLEASILLWVPRPWLSAIQQSAPQFWHSRTGVFYFAGDPTPTVQHPDYSERFASSRNLDFDDFQPSILEEVPIPAELEAAKDSELDLEENFDFPADEPVNHQELQEEVALPTELLKVEVNPELHAANNSENYLESLPSLSHISKQLSELVLTTINTKIIADDEEISQAQQMLAEIERLHAENAPGEALGAAYHKLGNFYRLRIEQGQVTAENLMVAIIAYQESITFDDTSPQLPDILNDLGTLYWMLYRTPSAPEEGQTYIEQGIEFYKLALKLISPQTHPETYARVQNNLGTAYGDLARFAHPPDCWEQAVIAYNEALRYRTVAMEPLKYAACQNNLGTAYWHLGQYNQPVVNLKKAIASYNLALAHYNPQDEPLKYGMIQNNIGTAYWNLAQYEQPAHNLRMAIDVYCDALKYRTAATVPSGCAATQNNLGTAYWHLANLSQTPKEDKYNYLRLCIAAYDEALALAHSLNPAALSFDVLATHNNLGLAHYQIATDQYFNGDKTQRTQHLEAALNNHLQALNGLSKQPEAYQTTFSYVVKTVRAFHSELGIQGQNLALSKVPAQMLPEILPKL